ncbi:hypothetical protein ABIF52_008693 [Bradyrhizobium japonicum]|uniref:hypothetical protein n=1 Tax=Bradyrhizobium diazoefficiens TaxID=1355477 RepID=UPI003486F4BD
MRRLLIAIERTPEILEAIDMTRTIGRPIQLAGFAGRLARAERIETELAVTGERYDTVLDDIADQHAALKTHVGSLETTRSALDQVIARMAPGSNGGPNDGSEFSSGSDVAAVGQVIEGRAEA